MLYINQLQIEKFMVIIAYWIKCILLLYNLFLTLLVNFIQRYESHSAKGKDFELHRMGIIKVLNESRWSNRDLKLLSIYIIAGHILPELGCQYL